MKVDIAEVDGNTVCSYVRWSDLIIPLRKVRAEFGMQRNPLDLEVAALLGFLRDHIGVGIMLEPCWNMCRAWVWLLQHCQASVGTPRWAAT